MKKYVLALAAIMIVMLGSSLAWAERKIAATTDPATSIVAMPASEVTAADFKKLTAKVDDLQKSTKKQFTRLDGELEAQKEVSNEIEGKVDGRLKDLSVKIDRHEGWLTNLTNAHNKTVISLESLRKNVGENIDKLFQIIYWVFGAIGLFVVIVAVMSRRR